MHRFQPRIYLVIRNDDSNGPIVDIEREKYRSFIYPETIFTAVTAYQNQLVSVFAHIFAYWKREGFLPLRLASFC
jgi:hypothetical protein